MMWLMDYGFDLVPYFLEFLFLGRAFVSRQRLQLCIQVRLLADAES